jgi:hypothetical protein
VKKASYPRKYEMFQGLDSLDRERFIQESIICLVCMRHVASQEYYGKDIESKPAYSTPECGKKQAKELGYLLTKESNKVNVLDCEEDEKEENCMNAVMAVNE